MTVYVGRREFITLVGGTAAAWPMPVRAQQPDRVRRIGLIVETSADHPQGWARVQAFLRTLQQLGWSDGGSARIDYRWGASDAAHSRRYAAELVALAPDVVLAGGSSAVAALQQAAPNLRNRSALSVTGLRKGRVGRPTPPRPASKTSQIHQA